MILEASKPLLKWGFAKSNGNSNKASLICEVGRNSPRKKKKKMKKNQEFVWF